MDIKSFFLNTFSKEIIDENTRLQKEVEALKKITINSISEKHFEWLKEMGWVGATTPLEQLALICSEIGEAVNECRGKEPTDNLGSELSDIVLRVFGMAKNLGIDMELEIENKMLTNRERGNKGRLK